MFKHKIILALSLCIGLSAAGLAFMAFRFASHEKEFRKAEIREILSSECEILAERAHALLRQEQKRILLALESTNANKNAVLALQRKSPLIRETFITDSKGLPIFPSPNGRFFTRYDALFFERISSAQSEKQISQNSAPVPKTKQKASYDGKSRSISMFDSFIGRQRRQTAEVELPQENIIQEKSNVAPLKKSSPARPLTNGKRMMLSRFGIALEYGQSGWIPWFAGNRFCPIAWAKSKKSPGKIIGAEIETIAILSRLISLFPQKFPDYYRFELTDSHGKRAHGAGFKPKSEKDFEKISPVITIPVSPTIAPNWQIRGYIDPAYSPGGKGFAMASLLQIISLMLIIGAAGGILFYLVRREVLVAGQKTSFVANVSHELKTPLTSIRMYAEMLLANSEKISREKQNKYLSIVLTESERLSRLISNVLNFSRMEAGEKKYNPTQINLNELLIEITEAHSHAATGNGMEIKLELPEGELTAFMDRDSLIQIIQNLISNAFKYAKDGGELTISLKNFINTPIIEVMDRGNGIPVASRSRIFNKFYRCDNSLTAETKGSGLGLSIARGLIKDHGGDLTYSTRPGGGSIFRITIPRGKK
jgi:signal transduction histidine kinase